MGGIFGLTSIKKKKLRKFACKSVQLVVLSPPEPIWVANFFFFFCIYYRSAGTIFWAWRRSVPMDEFYWWFFQNFSSYLIWFLCKISRTFIWKISIFSLRRVFLAEKSHFWSQGELFRGKSKKIDFLVKTSPAEVLKMLRSVWNFTGIFFLCIGTYWKPGSWTFPTFFFSIQISRTLL